MPRFLLPGLLLALACSVHAAEPGKDTSPWWGHIKVLASDDFQGRLTGSPGYRKAAEYVAHEFERAGLQPAGSDGYFQKVDLEVQSLNTAGSRVRLTRHHGQPLDISDAVALAPGTLQRTATHAALVFAGYGIHMPEAGYDDFAGLDVHGAVVVLIVGGPRRLTGAQRAHAYAENLPHFLEQAGAVGILSITNPKNREVPWARQKDAVSQPGMLLAERALQRFHTPMFSAAADETRVAPLFARSGHRFEQLLALADAHEALPHFRLATGIDAHVETSVTSVAADNVIAELPGSDPALGAQALVLSAHLDHLGTGRPDHGDGIFHGAMDDASGIASLLEVARTLGTAQAKPRRSILLLAVCGEEKGLLGSRYFAAHPTRHAGRIVADINTDMFLPLYPLQRLIVYGADESTLGDDVRAVAAAAGVQLVPDPMPDHLIFVRSDQYNFVRKGTPAVMLVISPGPSASEQATFHDWFATRYHAQADDLSQPVDLAAASAYNNLIQQLAIRVADAPAVPAWHQESFFARFATNPLP